MSKKTFFLIILIIILIVGGILGFLYVYLNKGTSSSKEQGSATNFFPFGNGSGATTPLEDAHTPSSTDSNSYSTGTTIPQLRQLSLVPVAGAIAFTQGSTTVFRYIERGTGHIYEATSDSLTQTRLSNMTIPRVMEALWSTKSNLILRYLDTDETTIKNFSATLVSRDASSTTPQKTLTGRYLPDTQTLAIAPKSNTMFYMNASSEGSTGYLAKTDSNEKVLVFNSAFKEWLPQFIKEGSILLTTKPSSDSNGFSYLLDTKNGKTTKILGGIRGLTTLANADGTQLLYSQSSRSDFSIKLLNIKNGKTDTLLINTLPEKCVWGNAVKTNVYCANLTGPIPQASYPDDWYKGLVHFSDDIWKLDTLTGELTQVAQLKSLSNQEFDLTNPSLDDKDTYLIFNNKNDLTLWSLQLTF